VQAGTTPPDLDAGPPCKLLAGPVGLSLRAPPILAPRGADLLVIQNDDGHPRSTTIAATTKSTGGASSGGLGLPCALAGSLVFCPDKTGGVHRARADGSEDRVVASSRAGSRVAAAELANVHTVVGYLASRQTSEGWVSEAWMIADDEPPVRISEDGSGATSVSFAPRGASVVAISIDARTALTAMHARIVSFEGHAKLGEDVVAFIGGPGDRRTRAALALAENGAGWSLLPIAKDVGQFGLALVRLDDPPRLDEPVQWSMYPNGLDPAPVAAVAASDRTWVARVRPKTSEPASAHVLEVGSIDAAGAFQPRDVVPTAGNPADVALALDPGGALWISWVDPAGAWVERLGC
jgi:hypothetical protein